MVAKILWDIKYLSFVGDARLSINDFVITNDNSLRDHFYTDDVLFHLGDITKNYSKKDNPAFAYSEFDIDVNDKSLIDIKKELAHISREKLVYLKTFLSFLWFVKDNSIGILNAIIFIPEIKGCVLENTIKSLHVNCVGKSETVWFTQSETLRAKDIYLKFTEINKSPTWDKNAPMNLPPINWNLNDEGKPSFALDNQAYMVQYSEFNCIERALVFLNTARKTDYLVYKIAYYMPIFECLFTTDKAAVTHKVCERLAIYLEEDRDKRIELYNFMENVYNIRSTFLHGQKFSAADIKSDQLIPISTRMDELVRSAFLMIILYDSDNFIGKTPIGNSTTKFTENRIKYLKYLMFS